jgi:hypothetical protein
MRGADLRSVDQLTPEPAEEISQADQVIFIERHLVSRAR